MSEVYAAEDGWKPASLSAAENDRRVERQLRRNAELEGVIRRRNRELGELRSEVARLTKDAESAGAGSIEDRLQREWDNAEEGIPRRGDLLIQRDTHLGDGAPMFRVSRSECDWSREWVHSRIIERAPRPKTEAEKIQEILDDLDGAGFMTDPVLLSRHLAERGVKVVDSDG
jgi:hypothetical protein